MISGAYLHSTLSALHSHLGSPRRNYFSIITTDLNVLHFGSITSKRLLKLLHWWLKNKERKVDFRFFERKFLAAINLTGSAEGALVPVLLRITHWTKSGLERTARFTARPFSALRAVSRKPRKLFGPEKPLQNLEPYEYRAVLFTYPKDEGRFPSYKKFRAYTLLRF